MGTDDKQLQEAVSTVGRLCFDASVAKQVCIRRAKRMIKEIDKMILALEEGK